MQLPLILGIIVVRNIALPAIGVAIVKGAAHFGLIHEDPLYEFLLLLQYALPPAVAISKCCLSNLEISISWKVYIYIYVCCLNKIFINKDL